MTVKAGQSIDALDVIQSKPWYAADAGSTDAYAVSLPESPASYTDGLTIRFKANTANTGPSTLNVNTLGAIAIKRPDTSDTQDGDILANQIVEVVYRSGSFYMVSPAIETSQFSVGSLRNSLVKLYFNVQMLFTLWAGAVDNDTTTTFDNWIRSAATDISIPGSGIFAQFTDTGSATIYANCFEGTSRQWTFGSTNKIILDFWARFNGSATGAMNAGLVADPGGNPATSLASAYNSSAQHKICFTQSAAGVLYATIAKNGVGVTNTDVSSGITLTNWNNYRIEADLGTDAKFYINGVLVATLSGANLPTTNSLSMAVGFGRSDTKDFEVMAPNLSIEMN